MKETPHKKFAKIIVHDLEALKWTPEEISIYLEALTKHGVLSSRTPSWEVRSRIRAWPVTRPTTRPLGLITQ